MNKEYIFFCSILSILVGAIFLDLSNMQVFGGTLMALGGLSLAITLSCHF